MKTKEIIQKQLDKVNVLNSLFTAMLERREIRIKYNKKHYLIQRINIDGLCDIYDRELNEIVFYDIPADCIVIC